MSVLMHILKGLNRYKEIKVEAKYALRKIVILQ